MPLLSWVRFNYATFLSIQRPNIKLNNDVQFTLNILSYHWRRGGKAHTIGGLKDSVQAIYSPIEPIGVTCLSRYFHCGLNYRPICQIKHSGNTLLKKSCCYHLPVPSQKFLLMFNLSQLSLICSIYGNSFVNSTLQKSI